MTHFCMHQRRESARTRLESIQLFLCELFYAKKFAFLFFVVLLHLCLIFLSLSGHCQSASLRSLTNKSTKNCRRLVAFYSWPVCEW